MRVITRILLVAVMPLIATGCKSSTTVENVTITNDMVVNTADANAMAPGNDGMINYAAPATSGNTSGGQ